ncbi:hypothetical protein [Chitinophaga pinensis]|uniref:Uncharacterized protein n=1 Tax=Chitinophaga pinensis (strain ATCC 43595 / DSM 2588 / LMG 13176 / NBRC 15968 / NCIMB 11800 / UQM 2034) TaxID=485918 RepID=A0A979GU12_CHIPD|nr:hypothetical protein [Chitinophaga pinensis]ACU62508.1 hypothetical protein Cpin_5076 [Chitinophaga pinensis DSM 2588]
MQRNTTALTTTEIELLEELHAREQSIGKTRLKFGLILLLAAVLITISGWYDINVRSVGMLLLIPGLFFTIFAIIKRRKSKQYSLSQHNTKQEVSGILVYAELVSHGVICYTFRDCQVELYIPTTNSLNRYESFSYKSLIDKADILTGTSVTLSYLTLRPGVNILLDIHYDEYSHVESLIPVNATDIEKFEGINYKNTWICLGTATVITILWGLDTGFSAGRTLLIFLFFIAIIPVMFYSNSKKKLARNKLVIRTTVTEVLHLLSEDEFIYYRLADGTLFHVSNRKYDPGDRIEIQIVENSQGGKETFIREITI